MTEVRTETELGAGVDDVWKVVGDFRGFVEAVGAPVTTEGDAGVGQVRHIQMGDATISERVEALDAGARSITYSILSGPLPVQAYRATMEVHAAGAGRSRLTWVATFEPAGVPEDAAANVVRAVFDGGTAALRARFGA